MKKIIESTRSLAACADEMIKLQMLAVCGEVNVKITFRKRVRARKADRLPDITIQRPSL